MSFKIHVKTLKGKKKITEQFIFMMEFYNSGFFKHPITTKKCFI